MTEPDTILIMRLGRFRWRAVWTGVHGLLRWEEGWKRDKVLARADARLLAEQNTPEYQQWVSLGRPM